MARPLRQRQMASRDSHACVPFPSATFSATYRQTDRQPGKQTDIHTYRPIDRQAGRQAGRQADRPTDNQAGHAGSEGERARARPLPIGAREFHSMCTPRTLSPCHTARISLCAGEDRNVAMLHLTWIPAACEHAPRAWRMLRHCPLPAAPFLRWRWRSSQSAAYCCAPQRPSPLSNRRGHAPSQLTPPGGARLIAGGI